MNLFYNDRPIIEQSFIKEICYHIISQPLKDKEYSNDFAACFIDGRSRDFYLEDLASLWSFKAFSKKNYPIFLFLYDAEKFLEGFHKLNIKYDFRLIVNKIGEIRSLEEYSKFCINELYFKLPPEIENVLTLQSDGMLLKNGWEDFILNNNFDWISPHWRHYARIQCKQNGIWSDGFNLKPVCIGNGGFSYRKVSKLKSILSIYKNYEFKEFGRNDDRIPMEDLWFTFLGFNGGFFKIPTLKQCDEFAVDPLTLDIWNSKSNLPFGFHFFRSQPEFPPCSHE